MVLESKKRGGERDRCWRLRDCRLRKADRGLSKARGVRLGDQIQTAEDCGLTRKRKTSFYSIRKHAVYFCPGIIHTVNRSTVRTLSLLPTITGTFF